MAGTLLTQATGDGTLALARDVPSVGYQRLSAGRSKDAQLASQVHLDGDEMSAANSLIKVRINEMGQLVSLYDLRADREVLSGRSSRQRVAAARRHPCTALVRFAGWNRD